MGENCCYEKEVGSIKYKWVEENFQDRSLWMH